MTYVLFIVYVFLGWLLLRKMPFITRAGFNTAQWSLLYLLKISAGIAIGWISLHYYPQGSDYWMIHRESLINYEMLKDSPVTFFKDLFTSPYGHYGGYFESVGSYWTDLRNNIVIKLAAILNVFSNGNYYINSIFFNVPGFIAHVAIYRMFKRFYPQHNIALIIGAFLLPSALYFSSGIHKDALLFMAMAFICYSFIHRQTSLSRKRIFISLISLLMIVLIRSYVLLALIPAIIAFRFSFTLGNRKAYMLIYGILLAGCVTLSLFTSYNPAKLIAKKQQAFLALPIAKSQIPIDTLNGTSLSLAKAFPQALNNITTQPRIWEHWKSTLFIPAVEWMMYVAIILLAFLIYSKNKLSLQPILFCLTLVIPLMLLIGYIVPNAGSIIRYKSLYLPYLITPFLVILSKHIKHIILKYI